MTCSDAAISCLPRYRATKPDVPIPLIGGQLKAHVAAHAAILITEPAAAKNALAGRVFIILAAIPLHAAKFRFDPGIKHRYAQFPEELADAVSAVAVERLVAAHDVDRLLPTATVILECAAARTDRKEALSMLARHFENLAFVSPSAALPEVLDSFRIMQSLNEELAIRLGRAIATARLGLAPVAKS